MVKICPVSTRQVNENISRLNAVVSFILSIAFLFTGNIVFPLIILTDFLMRNIYDGRFNPVIRMNSYIANTVSMRVHLINAGPKIFAARIGLILSGLSLILIIFSLETAGMIPLIILGFFSFLEGFFSFCVACKLYPVLRSWSL